MFNLLQLINSAPTTVVANVWCNIIWRKTILFIFFPRRPRPIKSIWYTILLHIVLHCFIISECYPSILNAVYLWLFGDFPLPESSGIVMTLECLGNQLLMWNRYVDAQLSLFKVCFRWAFSGSSLSCMYVVHFFISAVRSTRSRGWAKFLVHQSNEEWWDSRILPVCVLLLYISLSLFEFFIPVKSRNHWSLLPFRNHVVDKLIRVCMIDGKKETSRENVYSALEIVKRRQYKAWLKASTEEEKVTVVSVSCFYLALVHLNFDIVLFRPRSNWIHSELLSKLFAIAILWWNSKVLQGVRLSQFLLTDPLVMVVYWESSSLLTFI